MVLSQLELWQIALLFLPLLFVFASLWHISKHSFPTIHEKYYWILLCSFLPPLGTLIYLIFGLKRIQKDKNI